MRNNNSINNWRDVNISFWENSWFVWSIGLPSLMIISIDFSSKYQLNLLVIIQLSSSMIMKIGIFFLHRHLHCSIHSDDVQIDEYCFLVSMNMNSKPMPRDKNIPEIGPRAIVRVWIGSFSEDKPNKPFQTRLTRIEWLIYQERNDTRTIQLLYCFSCTKKKFLVSSYFFEGKWINFLFATVDCKRMA